MKKKILVSALALAMISILTIGGSLAYFTSEGKANNVLTVGSVKINVIEPNGSKKTDHELEGVYPGQMISKDPTIENIGKNPCLVRVKVDMPVDGIIYSTNGVDHALGENWVDGLDGFFYFLLPMEASEKTTAVFDQVTIPDSLTNNDSGKSYQLVVNAYAVQAQGVFSDYGIVADGISAEELKTVKNFFNAAFLH